MVLEIEENSILYTSHNAAFQKYSKMLYSPWNDRDPEMTPNPEMIPKSTLKWSSFFPRWPGNDPQVIIGAE